MTITRLLVANRGEIARRVFRTCRELGIDTVAVFSDADAGMPFVREADQAVRLPGNTPAETYLRGDLVVAAALAAGADAVHPGYGFLSENAAFARAVIEAGLTWVGPDPSSIESMGSKIESKKLMSDAGVPVLDGFTGAEFAADASVADGLEAPVLVKASAGGGGRGMRIVNDLADLGTVIEQASSEAASAFGDGTVFVEPYVQTGRHIEVQVMGTPDGAIVFGERDCSVQRRHQKVIEEAPAPALPDGTRKALHEAARQAAEAIDYRGAGTVEFLYDVAKDRFYFLEMNTRLQVEHPVTEAVHGVDLVALQIAVAEGRSLAEVTVGEPQGHAVEVRLYAEDPAHGYQPQSGTITRFELPGVVSEFETVRHGIRLDSGVGAGDSIGTFYDAMIAKVISFAPTRDQALRQLAGALAKAQLHGLTTNRDLLVNLLRSATVIDATMDTTWLDGADLAVLGAPTGGADAVPVSGFAAAVALAERARLASAYQSRIPAGFRNVVSQPQRTVFRRGDEELVVGWYGGRSFRSADLDGVVVLAAGPDEVTLEQDGVQRTFTVYVDGDHVDVESSLGHVALIRAPRFVDPSTQVAAGSLLAPMPGSVVAVSAAVGDTVAEGQPLLVMEAMKMQHTISAPYAGTVTELDVAVGQQVEAGAVLAVVAPDTDSTDSTDSEES
ncbi:acetyl/propionyl/methylcrotonyl-CoA carboxylase subunit alpha [Nocardioides jiangxiensis]|uniref:Biotin carboxylase N-terminal domain-containing protein n=1 Tax=Nocardioides jiangxiensis TaxID=3064524 RepID=A0ABT9B0X9_9ACTN|nr:biotin carboxylase N-terminal domain-containing protein [Nocardioides sp. WY-20]MDO7868050.1 biotin carboxylase N-terminal domain-containing protein [Nocardioides sp. WY-20]